MKTALIVVVLACAACGGLAGEQGLPGKDGNSIVGQQGATGATGAPGLQGSAGPQGVAGTNGTNGTNGANGNNAPGLVWVDSTNTPMPFINVTDANYTVSGMSGYVSDPNGGYFWAFTYDPNNGFVASPAEPNRLASAPNSTWFYPTTDCSGAVYIPWNFQKNVTVTVPGAPDIYAAKVNPSVFAARSTKVGNYGTCTRITTASTASYVPGINGVAIDVYPPATVGNAPYSLTWQE